MSSSSSSSKASFPSTFHWGYATASGQIEGSQDVDGKSLSIWDTFSADPSHSEDGQSNVVATDSWKKWAEDIKMMQDYGVNAYRLSLAWTRIVPSGKKGGEVNAKGVEGYRQQLKALRAAGITPYVTLFHWDLPQSLYDEYLGFLSPKIVPDFEYYAKVCYESFGDLVTDWFTINEFNIISLLGHCVGRHAPGRSSDRNISKEGDSMTEPLICGHNLLLAHAAAVKVYREQFQAKQKGQISGVVNVNGVEPYDDTPESHHAVALADASYGAWFLDPLVFGDYPQLLKDAKGDLLPTFTEEQKTSLKGSIDFLAMNHYTTMYAKKRTEPPAEDAWMEKFMLADVQMTFLGPDGKYLGPEAGLSWVRPVPDGFERLLVRLSKKYKLPIYIAENGVVCPNENKLPREEALNDDFRIGYLTSYADAIARANTQGADVRSYLMWALTDNFEWQEGFTARFGVTWIDYEDDCKRYPKKSAGAMKAYFAERMEKA